MKLEELLKHGIETGGWGTAYQAVVIREGGTVVDIAGGWDGAGAEVGPGDLFSMYCAGKPLLALTCDQLVQAGELSWNDRIGDLIVSAMSPSLERVTVEQILSHTSGLKDLPTAALYVTEPAGRRGLLTHQQAAGGTATGHYSDMLGWELLALGLCDQFGGDIAELVDRYISLPLELADDLLLRVEGEMLSRLRTNVRMSAGKIPTPLSWELSPQRLKWSHISSGVMATCQAMARVYADLVAPRSSQTLGSSSRLFEPYSPLAFDPVLGREAQYGLGFMVDLGAQGFGDGMSAASFGHSGLQTMTVCGAEPAGRIAFCVHVNGAADAGDGTAHERRWLIGTAVLDDAR